MDRTYWVEANDLLPGEKIVAQQATVRLYDGEEKVRIPNIDHLLLPKHHPLMSCRQVLKVAPFN